MSMSKFLHISVSDALGDMLFWHNGAVANKAEKEIEVKEVATLSKVIEGLKEKSPGLVNMRIPVCNSAVPLETDFDIFIKTLIGTNTINPAIINDQEFQTSVSF